MTPFNPKEPVQRRDGTPARIICTDHAGEYPIIALVGEYEAVLFYRADGRGVCPNSHDLINIPVQRTGWINVYEGGRVVFHPTRESAEVYPGADREACIEITWIPGEGL